VSGRKAIDLKLLRSKVETVVSVVNVCVTALEGQGADVDGDTAEVLRRYVCDPLGDHIEQLERLEDMIGR
jgi:hypothetical protein